MTVFPRALAALALMVGASACGRERDADGPGRDSLRPLAEAEWELLSLDSTAPVAGTRLSLNTARDGIGGYAGCNWFGARYTIAGDTLRVDHAERTARGCLRPGVTEQEDRFLQALHLAARYEITGDTLRFMDSSDAAAVILIRRRPLAMNPSDLPGTSWSLSSYTSRTVPDRPRITLAFQPETIRGFGGCRNYTGEWKGIGDRIRFPRLSMVSTECPNMSMNEIEGDFTTGLSEATHYRLADSTLELFTVGGDTLRFLRR